MWYTQEIKSTEAYTQIWTQKEKDITSGKNECRRHSCRRFARHVRVSHAPMHSKGRSLSIGLSAVNAFVRLVVGVNNVVFVQTRVLRKPFSTTFWRANVRFFTYTATQFHSILTPFFILLPTRLKFAHLTSRSHQFCSVWRHTTCISCTSQQCNQVCTRGLTEQFSIYSRCWC